MSSAPEVQTHLCLGDDLHRHQEVEQETGVRRREGSVVGPPNNRIGTTAPSVMAKIMDTAQEVLGGAEIIVRLLVPSEATDGPRGSPVRSCSSRGRLRLSSASGAVAHFQMIARGAATRPGTRQSAAERWMH